MGDLNAVFRAKCLSCSLAEWFCAQLGQGGWEGSEVGCGVAGFAWCFSTLVFGAALPMGCQLCLAAGYVPGAPASPCCICGVGRMDHPIKKPCTSSSYLALWGSILGWWQHGAARKVSRKGVQMSSLGLLLVFCLMLMQLK